MRHFRLVNVLYLFAKAYRGSGTHLRGVGFCLGGTLSVRALESGTCGTFSCYNKSSAVHIETLTALGNTVCLVHTRDKCMASMPQVGSPVEHVGGSRLFLCHLPHT